MDDGKDRKTKKASAKSSSGKITGSTSVKFKNKGTLTDKGGTQNIRRIDKEDILSRLNKILEADPENGREKVSLFAGRCALRVFPKAIEAAEYFAGKYPEKSLVESISIIWRALMSGWYNIPFAGADAAADATKSTKSTNSPADNADNSAANAANTPAAYAADANGAATSAAVGAVVAADNSYAAKNIIIGDLAALESMTNSLLELRRFPLWRDEVIPDSMSNWQLLIDGLIAESDVAAEINLLQKIKTDYQAILNGAWDDDNPLTKNTAVEKPEDDNPSVNDFLGRDKLVKALEPRLSIPDDANHLTIGLLGNWGIGKSSVIEQLQKSLDRNNTHTEYLFGDFNAWKYEKTQNLQAGITHEMISALTTARKEWPWYQRWTYKPMVIGEFAARLHGARIIGIIFLLAIFVVTSILSIEGEIGGSGEIQSLMRGVVGVGSFASLIAIWQLLKTVTAQPLAKELKTYLRLPSYQEHLGTIPVMEKQIKTLCEICLNRLWSHNQRRLVFFIDDLDRCGVEGIVQTFEAVRLVLGIRWVTVVIAMDQRIALPALACHYKQLSEFHQQDPMSIARDYLGKVIHLPVSLSEPDDLGIAQYLAKLWEDEAFFHDRIPVKASIPQANDEVANQNEDIQETNSTSDEPKESLQDIIDDINKMDVRAALLPSHVEPPPGGDIETVQQLSAQQKVAFYDWLLKLNLRNPRQIKRLYNSYNLLWSHYNDNWPEDEHQHPYMVALFILEMINEYVAYDEAEDTKARLREDFFSSKHEVAMPDIADVDFEELGKARKIIFDYQNAQGVNLLARIEPFVLPASSPQQVDNK